MSIRDFFHGSGKITAKDQFVPLRLIKENLEKKFRILTLEETPHRLKCKIIRFCRLYAAPMPFPNPSLEVSFNKDNQEVIINYTITCYDYYLVIIVAAITGISSARVGFADGMMEAFFQGFLFAVFVLLFLGGIVLIDARLFAARIRKALLNLGK